MRVPLPQTGSRGFAFTLVCTEGRPDTETGTEFLFAQQLAATVFTLPRYTFSPALLRIPVWADMAVAEQTVTVEHVSAAASHPPRLTASVRPTLPGNSGFYVVSCTADGPCTPLGEGNSRLMRTRYKVTLGCQVPAADQFDAAGLLTQRLWLKPADIKDKSPAEASIPLTLADTSHLDAPDAVEFGTVSVGAVCTRRVPLRSRDGAPFRIVACVPERSEAVTLRYDISDPGDVRYLELTLRPTVAGRFALPVRVEAAGQQPAFVTITCRGTAVEPPTVSAADL